MKLAEKLRFLRDRESYTQSQAAEIAGVSIRTYKAYELDERKPKDHNTYVNISNHYNVNLYSLVNDDLDMYSNKENDNEKDKEIIINEMLGLFAGGKMSLEDKKTVLDTLEEAYYIAKMKEENK